MAIVVVQAKSAQSAGTGAVAVTMTVTAGNTLVVLCANNSTTQFATNAVTDVVDAFTRHVSKAGTTNCVAIFSAPNATGGSTIITLTAPGITDFPTIAVYEVSGLLTTSSIDASASNNGGPTTAHSTGTTGTTTQADEIIFCVDTHDGATSTPTVTAGYTLGTAGQGLETNAVNQPLASARRIISATGTQTATFTWQNANFSAAIATFKAAGGGAATGFMGTNTGYWGT